MPTMNGEDEDYGIRNLTKPFIPGFKGRQTSTNLKISLGKWVAA